MAKTPFSPLEQWNGRVGSEIYVVHNGKQVVKPYLPRKQGEPTPAQIAARSKFERAAWYWRNFYRETMPLNQFIKAYYRYPEKFPDKRFVYSITEAKPGDVLFFDHAAQNYCLCPHAVFLTLGEDYDPIRYETNTDTFIGMQADYAHFVAKEDAMPVQSLYYNTVAATPCFYRIEIDNSVEGKLVFSANTGKPNIPTSTISWDANNSIEDILQKFKQLSIDRITFDILEDGSGIGVEINGYGANNITVVDAVSCSVIDCSSFAFYRSQNPTAPEVGGFFDKDAGFILINPNAHNSFLGVSASSILTNMNLVTANQVCVAVNGYNYSSRCGVNFAKWKQWASINGENTFFDDGEGAHIEDPGAHVMNEVTFNLGVKNYTGSDEAHLGMKDYYTHLFNDTEGEFAELRQYYESMYGTMTGTPGSASYDAYLMSHMIDPAAISGIVGDMRNKGSHQTEVKADCMNVNYNYIVIPAYPPEFNAHNYGKINSDAFGKSTYFHPEPGDLALFLRDDIMPLVNENITAIGLESTLTNNVHRGVSTDYAIRSSWYFSGERGCIDYFYRYSGFYRTRPVLTLRIS